MQPALRAAILCTAQRDDYYRNTDLVHEALRFMTTAVDCTEKLKLLCPMAGHIDGTARPQLVERQENPRIYRILEYYALKTGTAVLLNTSFNRHEEPIVCSPEDALRSFRECGLDVLVLNNFVVMKRRTDSAGLTV